MPLNIEYPQSSSYRRSQLHLTPTLPRMKKLIALTLFVTSLISSSYLAAPAYASDCIEKACIDVYTQDGKIIIEGRKGSGPVQRKSVAPAPTHKPIVKRSIAPKPRITGTPKPRVIVPRKAPVIRKRPTPAAKAQSLNDKLIEMLPTAGISYSPSFEPLVHVPVYLWCDIPTEVDKRIEIVGEKVDVKLKPTFFWHYGDGTFYVTTKPGAPYPDGEIRHTYSKAGHYLIELIINWTGNFSVGGATAPINGEIETVSVLPITIVAAPTRFTPSITYNR